MLQIVCVDRNPLSGSQLRHHRLGLGWSREQLAHQIGVDADTIASWENDASPITMPHTVEQILSQYDVTPRVAPTRSSREVAQVVAYRRR